MHMKPTKKMKRLLERMAQIERMERGKLCPMGERPHYNHQTWQEGKNVVRYVPAAEVEFVGKAIEGYEQFKKLAEQYADEVIRQTRVERGREFPKSKSARRKTSGKEKGNEGKTPRD